MRIHTDVELDGGDLGFILADVSADWSDEPQDRGFENIKVTTFLAGKEIDITDELKQDAKDYIVQQLQEAYLDMGGGR